MTSDDAALSVRIPARAARPICACVLGDIMVTAPPRGLAIAGVALGMFSVLAGCEAPPPPDGSGGPGGQAAPVGVSAPLVREVIDWDEYTGRFLAVEDVEVRARVSGYLQEIYFEDGQEVAAGDALFLIDPRPFDAAFDAAAADVLAAEARLRNATREAERGAELLERRAIASEEYDNRVTTQLEAQAGLDAARARQRAAELDREFTTVTSPIAGRVSDNRVSVGNLVSGGAGATLLTTVITTDPIYLEVEASEAQYLRYARLGIAGERPRASAAQTPVGIRLADETGWPHQGMIDFVEPRLDAATSTLRGRAVVPNPDGLFTPGLFARMRLPGSAPYDAFAVPDAIVLADQAGRFVWVMGEDGPSQRFVELGPLLDDGMRVIRAGLAADDRVVVEGLLAIRPGAPLAPYDAPLAAPSEEPAPEADVEQPGSADDE